MARNQDVRRLVGDICIGLHALDLPLTRRFLVIGHGQEAQAALLAGQRLHLDVRRLPNGITAEALAGDAGRKLCVLDCRASADIETLTAEAKRLGSVGPDTVLLPLGALTRQSRHDRLCKLWREAVNAVRAKIETECPGGDAYVSDTGNMLRLHWHPEVGPPHDLTVATLLPSLPQVGPPPPPRALSTAHRDWLALADAAVAPLRAPPKIPNTQTELFTLAAVQSERCGGPLKVHRFVPAHIRWREVVPAPPSAKSDDDACERMVQILLASDNRRSVSATFVQLYESIGAPRGMSQEDFAAFLVSQAEAIGRLLAPHLRARWQRDCLLFEHLRRSCDPIFSIEELRRYALAQDPKLVHLQQDYVQEQCRVMTGQPSFVDRMGAEPNFLLAAHVAWLMFSAPSGTRMSTLLHEVNTCWHLQGYRRAVDSGRPELVEALAQLRAQLSAKHSGTEVDPVPLPATLRDAPPVENGPWQLTAQSLDILRAAYPFIPRWGSAADAADDEVKGPSDLRIRDLHRLPSGSPGQCVVERLSALAQIPLQAVILDAYDDARGEHSALAGHHFFSIDHLLADKYAYVRYQVMVDELCGCLNVVLGKSYSGHADVADLLHRSFGVHVSVTNSEAELTAQAKTALTRLLADPTPLAVHLTGVTDGWQWLDDAARAQARDDVICVSHTTSDARDLTPLAGAHSAPNLTVAKMSSSTAKRTFERRMFVYSFVRKLAELQRTCVPDLDRYRFVVVGYGEIIGSAAVEALTALGLDVSVFDPKLSAARREELVQHFPQASFIDSLAGVEGRKSFYLGCVGKRVFGPEALAKQPESIALMSLSTGRRDFDMDAVVERSSDANGLLHSTVIQAQGAARVVSYDMQSEAAPGRVVEVLAIGDGHVANLDRLRPNATPLSAFNNVLIVESLRQAQWERERAGKAAGPVDLRHMTVRLTSDTDIPVVVLSPRNRTASLVASSAAVKQTVKNLQRDHQDACAFVVDSDGQRDEGSQHLGVAVCATPVSL